MTGIIVFVLTLKRHYYLKQFVMFGFMTCILLLLDITMCHVENTLNGVIWFLLPCLLVISNDTFAYIFGMLYGKRALISLSPKKTWEGFLGAAATTTLVGFLIPSLLVQFNPLICSLQLDENGLHSSACHPADVFRLKEYSLYFFSIHLYPIQFHGFFFGLATSFIGPFGGFFASGFKRAFRLKDFGNAIPGHGGFMDRFDCMIIMAVFVNVYAHSFIDISSGVSPSKKLFNQLLSMPQEDKIEFFQMLQSHFKEF